MGTQVQSHQGQRRLPNGTLKLTLILTQRQTDMEREQESCKGVQKPWIRHTGAHSSLRKVEMGDLELKEVAQSQAMGSGKPQQKWFCLDPEL